MAYEIFTLSTTCSIEGCEKPIECKGVCNAHYQRFRLYGRYESAVWGQSSHDLYNIWNERLNAGSLCDEWKEFKDFLKEVVERPSKNHRLARQNKKEVYSKTNYFWKEYIKLREGETKNQALSRRRAENPEIYKRAELLKAFDLPYEEWEAKLKSQNYVCEICKQPEKTVHHISGKLKALAVDHCHASKEKINIRGLLCQRCNRVLGKVNDNTDLLNSMIKYLNKYRTIFDADG